MTKKVFIQKIKETPNGFPSVNWDEHVPGTAQKENKSLPIEYSVEGYLIEDIAINKSVMVERTKRNGVIALGLFSTSPVTSFNENTFTTKNSVYTYKYI